MQSTSRTTERRKAMTSYDITSSFVHTVDADRDEAREVLAQIDPMRSLADRLSALGLDDRAIWSEAGELGYTLVWRFGSEGYGRFDWRIDVNRDSADRTVLSVRLGARGSTAEARTRVLRSWLLVEELAAGHARRLARMLEEYADEDAYETALSPQLRLVV
jgi:hypothetical protein